MPKRSKNKFKIPSEPKKNKKGSQYSLPPDVAFQKDQKDPEDTNMAIVFDRYNHNECELHKFTRPDETKKLIKKFNVITSCDPSTLSSTGLIKDNIERRGGYLSLYDGIEDDITLKEIQFTNTGRIFFFRVRRCFYIVAIKNRHIK